MNITNKQLFWAWIISLFSIAAFTGYLIAVSDTIENGIGAFGLMFSISIAISVVSLAFYRSIDV